MNREEAYNIIDAIIAKHEIDDEYVTITSALDYDALRFARKLLEQEPWIPVSEKLPEEGKEILTCSNGGFIEIQSLEDSCADIYWENQKGDWTNIDEVIAWMPLPTPYELQESEG